MGIFNKPKKGGFSDVIRCDEQDYLIWKWHPNKYEEGDLKRDTAIRTNSVLRVKESEVAVFVYKQPDGNTYDYIVGPHDETLKTKNFPVLSKIIGLWYEGDTPFQAEVFFVNLGSAIQVKFGIPYFNVVDPRFVDYEVPVSSRGTITFKITDYKEFIKIHQLATFNLDDFRKKINDTVCRFVKDAIINAPSESNIPVIQIESKIELICEKVETKLIAKISELFGVSVTSFDINSIEIDKDSESYQELKRVTKEVVARQTEANIHNYEETLRIQREEGQYAQHMATRQQNIGAYQTEVSGQVGIAGAEALGKMGENGVGNINMGEGGNAGFNPMTMMAGMAVGSAIGQNIAGTMNNSMNPTPGAVPPPIPSVSFHVAVNGQAAGPYELNALKDMISSGQIKNDTLLWKQGTPSWARADSFDELKGLFPPSIPM